MSDYGTLLRDALLTAWRTAPVATAAGIAHGSWSSAAFPHVFYGQSGMHGHRNAGRLPFVELLVESAGLNGGIYAGGDMEAVCLARVQVLKLPDWDSCETLCRSIMLAGLKATRSVALMELGTEDIQPMIESDFGLAMVCRFTVDLTYDKSDYTIGA